MTAASKKRRLDEERCKQLLQRAGIATPARPSDSFVIPQQLLFAVMQGCFQLGMDVDVMKADYK